MTLRGLLLALGIWSAALTLLSLALFCAVRLDRQREPRGPYLVSVWREGKRVARAVAPTALAAANALQAEAGELGAERIIETIVDSAPLPGRSALLLAGSVAPGRDGVSASYAGKTAYATPDDLRQLEAYEPTVQVGSFGLVVGLDADKLLTRLASELGVSPSDLLRQGSFNRFASRSDAAYPRHLNEAHIDLALLQRSVRDAARYLLRNQQRNGSFRYELNAITGLDDENYNFPRHAGASAFLARVGNQFGDRQLQRAARRAVAFMARSTLRCGAHDCIGEGERVDVGSSALALLAYVELIEGGATEYREPALELAAFLRAQQRSDGDFQHFYSIAEQHPIDVQVEYYTGEAALALSRVHRVSGDARDLSAARRALAFLVQRSPWFLGARYFWGAEHWTCQVVEDLWQRAPDHSALDFCLRWQAATRRLQFDGPPAPPEYDGAISRGPFIVPRLTPLASRMEAAVATLAVARAAGSSAAEIELLDREIRLGFAFLLNHQFSPGPTHLMSDAPSVAGGFPGSPIDLHVRIDYPQHAAGALLKYWELQQSK